MMFGFKDKFKYLQCGGCSCIQIIQIPENLGAYYPVEYFPNKDQKMGQSPLKRFLRHKRAEYCLTGSGLLGKLLVKKWGRPKSSIFGKPDYYQWLSQCGVTFSSKVLEVGCGYGILLLQLHNDGFTDLTGVDPFVKETVIHSKRLTILKDEIYNITGAFDFIMLHHTFEHLPEPVRVLQQLHRLLRSGCHLLIRIPLAGSFACRTYGINWAQFDAPRHLFLHSIKSMKILANQTGFDIAKVVFDSNDFQFWASEQYLKGIPLYDKKSYMVNPGGAGYSQTQISEFSRRASELNANGDGDSACFYFLKR